MNLYDTVLDTVERVITAKEETHKIPACATRREIFEDITEQVRGILNVLSKSSAYEVHVNVNREPYLVRRRKDATDQIR